MSRKERASLTLALFLLVFSLLLVSILSNVISGYDNPHEDQKGQDGGDAEKLLPLVMFRVSPAAPRLYWSMWTADYYTGFMWLRTTGNQVLLENPEFRDANATRIFTVELNTSQHEFYLPLASPSSEIAGILVEPNEDMEIRLDTVGNVLNAKRLGNADREIKLFYRVSWNEYELDDGLISLDDIQQIYLEKYLQLPEISADVRNLAEELEDASYSVLDQVLADVQYLRNNFVYDAERLRSVYENVNQGSDVSSYISERKGICTDAATALAVILRIQGIPARICFGYKPGANENGQLIYYKNGGHAVTEVFLPPYGWVQFDATPSLEEYPLMKASSFKKYCSIGDSVYFQLSVTNRRPSMDDFRLFVSSRQQWNIEAAPLGMRIGAFQTTDAFLKVNVPDYAGIGEKDEVTLSVASLDTPEAAFSILVIIQVWNESRVTTTTVLRDFDGNITRGETFRVNGDILAMDTGQIDNMTTLIFVTKSTATEGTVVGKGYSKQGSFSAECLVPSFVDIGSYKLVPVSLGTTSYAPSRAESVMILRATTAIQFLNSNDEFLIGFGAIQGRLVWDNKTEIADELISFKVTIHSGQTTLLEFQNRTNAKGLFRISTDFGDPGEYALEVGYSGNEYSLGSDATRVVLLKIGRPTIQILAEGVAIRGEFFNVTGMLHYKNVGVLGEPLDVTFDNKSLKGVETGDKGYYAFSLPVDSEEQLGLHILTVTIEKGNVSAVHEFTVRSRTKSTIRVAEVAGGMFYLLSTSIFDDHDVPVQEAKVTVDGYALSGETDNNGSLAFLLDNVKFWSGNLTLAVGFDGSDLYLPTRSETKVFLAPMVSMSFLIPLATPLLVVIILTSAKCIVRSRRLVLLTHEGELDRNIAMNKAPQEESLAAQLVKILMPDIDARFPNLWGVNERVRIQIVVDDRVLEQIPEKKVAVSIDGESVAVDILFQEGLAEFSQLFATKGEHIIQATLHRAFGGQPLTAEITLRAVDYGEEIVRLYNELLEKLVDDGFHSRNEMTGREIEALLSETGNYDRRAIDKVTTCFENAEYSEHSISRKDYETMYTSLKELKIDVD